MLILLKNILNFKQGKATTILGLLDCNLDKIERI